MGETPGGEFLVDLLRHGAVTGGGGGFRGRGSDPPLSAAGWQAMVRHLSRAPGGALAYRRIVTSPLQRCAGFARHLGRSGPIPAEAVNPVRFGPGIPVSVDPRLAEMDFGQWEGRNARDLLTLDPDPLSRFWQDPCRHGPPDGEPLTAFHDRVVQAWQAHAAGQAGFPLLLVVHGGVIRMLLLHLLGLPLSFAFRLDVPPAGLTRVALQGDGLGRLSRLIFHAWSG